MAWTVSRIYKKLKNLNENLITIVKITTLFFSDSFKADNNEHPSVPVVDTMGYNEKKKPLHNNVK